jgi:hypothetical protein
MKKLWMILCVLMLASLFKTPVKANEYLTYEEIDFENYGAKLLEEYTKEEYKRYYKKVTKRRFWGWRTLIVIENEPVSFKKETLYVIKNEGTSDIKKNYTFKSDETSKFQISATGNIGMSQTGDIKGFKLGLEAEIKPSISYTLTKSFEEKVDIKISVDPMTILYVEVYGEGKITNGVGKYYRFWRNVITGGFEVFVLTTEYYSIVKERIEIEEPTEEADEIIDDSSPSN